MSINESKKRKPAKCPFCGKRNVARILYGMPAFSEDLQRSLDAGEIILGGCCQDRVPIAGKNANIDPSWFCNECKKTFGTRPLFFSKKIDSCEDYRDAVQSIAFTLETYRYGFITVDIKRNEQGALVTAGNYMTGMIDFPEKKELSLNEWNKLLDKLYSKMYLHEWKHYYEQKDVYVLDGSFWKLKMRLSGNRVRIYTGEPCVTPYWREMKTLFGKYINMKDINF